VANPTFVHLKNSPGQKLHIPDDEDLMKIFFLELAQDCPMMMEFIPDTKVLNMLIEKAT